MTRMAFVVDEDADMRSALGEFLENEGFTAVPFPEPKEALAAFSRGAPVLLITDSWTRSQWNDQFNALLSEANRSGCPVIIFTGWKATLLPGRSEVPIVSKPDIRTLLRCIRSQPPAPASRTADIVHSAAVKIAA
jgi:CheY-like chemotaxis protein